MNPGKGSHRAPRSSQRTSRPPAGLAVAALESRVLFSGASLDAMLPSLHSDPGAPAAIYLDFTGAPAAAWNGQSVPPTPAYDTDGNSSAFSATELNNIREIWSAVAEKFSPFNVDVTTDAPQAGQHTLTAIIGGDGQWAGGADGGLSVVGSFAKGPATVWVFSQVLNDGDPIDTADVIAHESGHAFGLVHQSVYNGTTLVDGYNPGNGLTAPIMGDSYNAIRALWWEGPDSNSANQNQDDMAIIASPANGFGYRPQDHGQSIAAAAALAVSGKNVSGGGVIEQTSDTDFFSFQTSGGHVNLQANVAQFGAMLHLKMVLVNSKGKVIAAEAGSNLGQSFKANLKAGTYYIEIESFGAYGDVGQYTITGTVPQPKAMAKAKPAAQATVAKSQVRPVQSARVNSLSHHSQKKQ